MTLNKFEARIQQAVLPGPSRDLAGCVIAGSNRDGSVEYAKAFGTRSVKDQAPLELDDVFWFASLTKIITAIACLQCVEKGQIEMDNPDQVRALLPEYAAPELLVVEGEDTNMGFRTVPAQKYFTLRDLLANTSGIGYDMFPPWHQWRLANGEKPMWLDREITKSSRLPLLFEPGTSFRYGAGSDWAGRIVERLNGGMKLGDYCQRHIFDRLGLFDMTFDLGSRPDLQARLVPSVTRWHPSGSVEDGLHPTGAQGPGDDHVGGAGLYGTAKGLLGILVALLRNDGAILQPESVKSMMTGQLQTPEVRAQMQQDMHVPENVAMSIPGLSLGLKWTYGLGGAVCLSGEEGKLHPGAFLWSAIPTCFWTLDAEGGYAYVYLTHVYPFGDPKTSPLRGVVREYMWDIFH